MSNVSNPAPVAVGNAKAYAATIAGGIALIAVYIIDQVTGKVLPPEICAAVQTVITGLAVWLVPHDLGS